jgi:hypothetical protein
MALTTTQHATRRWKSISCGDAADTTPPGGTVKVEGTSQPGQVHIGEAEEWPGHGLVFSTRGLDD